jgi:sodium transport system permease protein
MKNILTIINKEFAKFFGDKRLLFTACVMPGLMIYIIYFLIGGVVSRIQTEEAVPLTGVQTIESKICVRNLPASIEKVFSETGIDASEVSPAEADAVKARVAEKDALLYLVFPQDFDEQVALRDPLTDRGVPPNIEIYYNTVYNKSSTAYYQIEAVLNEYENSIANKFDVNRLKTEGDQEPYNLASDKDMSGTILTSILPMLVIIFLFTGCLAVVPESIAGEKERGTIAALLVTQIKRSELAMGKILSLMVIALLCGLSSMMGVVLSLRRLMGSVIAEVDISYYTVLDYFLLIVVVLSTLLIIVSILTNVSAFARSVKEAMLIANPMMVAVMMAGLVTLLGTNSSTVFYLIPIYNSAQCISAILAFNGDYLNTGVAIASNLIYSAVGIVLLSRMFNSERIVFTR